MAMPRPVTVYYPGGGIGHCSTIKRAIARATSHLLDIAPSRRQIQVNILFEGSHVCDIEIHWLSNKLKLPL